MLLKLDNEILIKILSYLEEADLKCLLYIKQFRGIIMQSPELMRNLPLKVKNNNFKSHNWVVKNYGKYFMAVDIVSETRPVSFLEVHGLLELLPNLESIRIAAETSKDLIALQNVQVSSFSNLKRLEVNADSVFIRKTLKYLGNCNQLDFLYVGLDINEHEDEISFNKEFANFLTKQTKLSEFCFRGLGCKLMDFVKTENIKFKLKDLVFYADYTNNFAEFLSTQTDLVHFHLNKFYASYSRYTEVLLEMRKLEMNDFDIDLKIIVQNPSILEKVLNGDYVLEKVKYLNFFNGLDLPKDYNLIESALKIFPNLRVLNLTFLMELHYGFLQNFPKLEAIRVDYGNLISLCNVELPNLKLLKFRKLHSSFGSLELWESFSTLTPKMEEFDFTFEGYITSTAFEEIKIISKIVGNWTKLKIFKARFTIFPHKKDVEVSVQTRRDLHHILSVTIDTKKQQITFSRDLITMMPECASLFKESFPDFMQLGIFVEMRFPLLMNQRM